MNFDIGLNKFSFPNLISKVIHVDPSYNNLFQTMASIICIASFFVQFIVLLLFCTLSITRVCA